MEKIQKALHKAREQRFNAQVSISNHEWLTPPQESARRRHAPIVYRDTRIAPVEPGALTKKRVIAGTLTDGLADTFRILRAQVLQRLKRDNCTTLAITSPNPQEGKTLTAVNLAISLAMDVNHTVLLVDLDLRKPTIHSFFDMEKQTGLTDHLLDQTKISDCLVNPGIERLVVLPAFKPLPNSSEILSSPTMVELARELKQKYPERIIIYDLPPLLSSDDSLVFMQQVDACLLVIEEGATRIGDVTRSIELLKSYNLIGTILNKSS